ncbi:MAG: hypothetical protein QOI24_3367 [Acidobacteriota bacterium]|nr:hypothetical protein [Acidobacteriota bacterium]
MSDISQDYPPPPPPPAPPRVPGSSYDVLRPFTYVFDDPSWLPKILIGGLFILASVVLIGVFFVLGYIARVARNVINNVERPLPEWDDLGDYFSEGLRLFGIGLVYCLPIIGLGFFFIVPMAIGSHADSDVVRGIATGIGMMFWCLIMPISLALAVWIPGAMLFSVVEGNFSAAFEFSRIARFIRANVANYLIAVVIYFVARFAAGAGIILCFIGVVFTGFWSALVAAYAFAQVYRLSSVK